MANTLTPIIATLYAALDMISRELVGFIPAVQRNAAFEAAAVGQTVTVPVVPAATGGNITPSSVPPDDGDMALGNVNLTITKSKYSPVRWNGEEQRAVGPSGMFNAVLANQFAQSMRWLVNQIEGDIGAAAIKGASRAYGTAGTTPFGTAGDFTDFAGVNKILDDNGAPQAGRRLVVNTASAFNLEGKQSILFKANEADTDEFLRRRILADVMGFGIGKSAALTQNVKGSGSGFLVNNGAGYAAGAKSLALDTGTGTLLAGNIVTFAGDSNKYVLNADGSLTLITINDPGLQAALADNTAMTLGNSYMPNVAFTEDAIILAAREPATPAGGDSADDRMTIQDPVSGLVFQVSLYREYRRIRYEVAMAWGVGIIKTNNIALLLG